MAMTKHTAAAALLTAAIAVTQFGSEARLSAQGPQEGIKVHGHWVIDVRDPDGTLVSHNEFENALIQGGSFSGSAALASVLTSQRTVAGWSVQLFGSACTGGQFIACVIGDAMVPVGPFTANNLQVSTATETVTLSGMIAAPVTGTIPVVETLVRTLGTGGEIFFHFSHKDLPTPTSVKAGQMVQVTVTFSFS
jgi:hypothetical protein